MARLKVWKFLSVWMVLVLMVGLGVGFAPATSSEAATTPVGSGTGVSAATVEKPLQFTSGGHVLGFSSDGVIIASADHMLKTEFIGSRAVAPEAEAAALAENNAGMASPLSRVTYHDVWDGVTVVYEASPGAIVESIYYVNATEEGIPCDLIRLGYNRPVSLDEQGNLVIAYDSGIFVESAPVAWQDVDGQRQPVTAAFALYGEHEVGFSLGDYVPGVPVVIDPDLIWNTFLGSSGNDYGEGIAVDGSGNVYVTGFSAATWGSPLQAYQGGNYDAFVAKLDSSGALVWHTFLGGGGDDRGRAIAVDGSGSVYVGGSGANWGTPVRAHWGTGCDAWAARLNSSGSLIWNTFLGGCGNDVGLGIAVNGSGNAYVAGFSDDTWASPVQAHTGAGNEDAFAAGLDSSGGLIWNTFLGGSGRDNGWAIAVDASGNAYVAGFSDDTWGSPVQAHTGAGNEDAFAARLDSSGGLVWNTFLGGSDWDRGNGIAVDGSGNVYVAGTSNATWGSPVRSYQGNQDAFAARLDGSGALIWNTFPGGSGADYGRAIAVDGSGNVYVGGSSTATWGSPLRAFTAPYDAFAARLNSSGGLIWNTFLGGSGNDTGGTIAVDGSGNAYVTGVSDASWGSPVRPYSTSVPYDAFVAKIGEPPPPPEPEIPLPPQLGVSPQTTPPHLPPSDVRLNSIAVSSSETQPGQPVTVLANLVNNGGSTGSYNVALRINGKVEQQRTVEVSPGTAYPVKFTVTKSEPGTYEVAIEGQRASFTVIGEGTSGAPASGGLIALIVIAVLILATAVVLTMTFRRPA